MCPVRMSGILRRQCKLHTTCVDLQPGTPYPARPDRLGRPSRPRHWTYVPTHSSPRLVRAGARLENLHGCEKSTRPAQISEPGHSAKPSGSWLTRTHRNHPPACHYQCSLRSIQQQSVDGSTPASSNGPGTHHQRQNIDGIKSCHHTTAGALETSLLPHHHPTTSNLLLDDLVRASQGNAQTLARSRTVAKHRRWEHMRSLSSSSFLVAATPWHARHGLPVTTHCFIPPSLSHSAT